MRGRSELKILTRSKSSCAFSCSDASPSVVLASMDFCSHVGNAAGKVSALEIRKDEMAALCYRRSSELLSLLVKGGWNKVSTCLQVFGLFSMAVVNVYFRP